MLRLMRNSFSQEMPPNARKAAFLPVDGSWFDLKSMILGFVFGTQTYMQAYPGLEISQRLNQQDPCENHFSHQRAAQGCNAHPNAYQAIWATLSAAGRRQVQDHSSTNNQAAKQGAFTPMQRRQ